VYVGFSRYKFVTYLLTYLESVMKSIAKFCWRTQRVTYWHWTRTRVKIRVRALTRTQIADPVTRWPVTRRPGSISGVAYSSINKVDSVTMPVYTQW